VAALVVSGLHLAQVVAELTMFRIYLNKGVNLEQRIKFTSKNRAKDLSKLGLVAIIFGAIALVIGWFSFKPQPCENTFFTIDNIMCFDCHDFHGINCLNCVSAKSCLACASGNYL
jgi:hypothetical protein